MTGLIVVPAKLASSAKINMPDGGTPRGAICNAPEISRFPYPAVFDRPALRQLAAEERNTNTPV